AGALGVDPHLAHPVGGARQLRLPAASPPRAGARVQRGGVDRREGGEVGEVPHLLRRCCGARACGAPGHRAHLPTMFWPHTRSVSPRIPPASAELRKEIASATSTGSPPCWRELRRRAISRVSAGILAVISVSMKPGATALAVPPMPSSRSASASTKAMTPAFEVA